MNLPTQPSSSATERSALASPLIAGDKDAGQTIAGLHEKPSNSKLRAQGNAALERRAAAFLRITVCVLASAICYYLATQIAWSLCFPDSKVSLFFPPHAVLISILLIVPTRHWWAYTLAAATAHFVGTQQTHW